ncbi:MAG TPA: hypothetical protein VFR56_01675, partial [Actinomycetes bacterium]|nr:hypothetical protein [Actinomycetes bacterium]
RELAGGLWFGARLVLEQTGPATDLLAVHLRPSGKQRLRLHAGEKQWLRLDTGAVRVVLLGRIGPEQALAQVHRADGPRAWQEDAELRVLDVSDARVESTVAGRVEAQGTGSTFSFATDYATADHPTVDFSAAGEQGRDTVSAGDGLPAPLDDVTTGWWWVVALGAAALTAVVVAAWQRRRIRSP